jgi:hypothetical protein
LASPDEYTVFEQVNSGGIEFELFIKAGSGVPLKETVMEHPPEPIVALYQLEGMTIAASVILAIAQRVDSVISKIRVVLRLIAALLDFAILTQRKVYFMVSSHCTKKHLMSSNSVSEYINNMAINDTIKSRGSNFN